MKLAESRTTKRYKYKRRNPNKNQCTTRKWPGGFEKK
jgi:hypothetical protein